ncbi:AI-2E family transporter [Modestobacter sp. NPDC049651]|uniref:AI-2E family transporter n=1 Tax=unclassified Modestobacter TaxID=2643866 RepID=UPI0033CC2C5A
MPEQPPPRENGTTPSDRIENRADDATDEPTDGDRPDEQVDDDRISAPGTLSTKAPAPGPERSDRLAGAVRRLAVLSVELLLITAGVFAIGFVAGRFWSVVLPVVLGLLFTTVLWPPTRFLRRHGWPPAAAAASVLLLFFIVIGGIIAAIAPQVVGQAEELGSQFAGGVGEVQDWLAGPPLNIEQDQISNAVDTLVDRVQNNATNIATYAYSTATSIGNILLNLVLALVLAFFFLKDGPRWTPWLAAQTGPKAAPHIAALSVKAWETLSEFIRQQALVGFVDAFFIGIGLWILGVPLVLPLAVLTFFGAFIPIIGAVVAGIFAVLVALVTVGFTKALIVLGIVLFVQQVEGNVLQPILQGRGLNLHAAVVILAVTAGSSLAGIIGAFLAVPVTALVAVGYRYARDVLDGQHPEVAADGTSRELVGDTRGAHLVAAQATPEDGGSTVRGRFPRRRGKRE